MSTDMLDGSKDRYATIMARIGAGLVDAMVSLVVKVILGLLGMLLLHGRISGWQGQLLTEAVNNVVMVIYSIVMHARFGQTVGKMVWKIRVLDSGEQRLPSFRQAVMRDIVVIASLVPWMAFVIQSWAAGEASVLSVKASRPYQLFLMIGVLWMALEIVTALFNAKRRAVHDLIAGTVVLKVP